MVISSKYLSPLGMVCGAVPGLLVCLLTACGQAPEEGAVSPQVAGKLLVYTVNYPLAYFAERLGGEHVEVMFPAPGDVDPAFWQPAAEEILGYQGADLIMLNGAGYAKWLARASLPSAALVDTSAGFNSRLIPVTGNVRHKHGPEGAHDHGEVAFTTWLDPELAALQVEAIRAALVKARPDLAAGIDSGYEALISDLAAWDAKAAQAFAELGDASIVLSHPVYQYLARHYGIDGQTFIWEADAAVSQDDLETLEQSAAAADQLKVVVWESEPLPANRAALAALGFASVVFDPLGNRPDSGDYLVGMAANVERLASIGRTGSTDD